MFGGEGEVCLVGGGCFGGEGKSVWWERGVCFGGKD